MFPDRDWTAWLPGKQIMRQIREYRMDITPHAKCRLECQGLTAKDFENARLSGEVDFSQSDTRANPRRYLLLHNTTSYIVLLTDSTSTLAEVSSGKPIANCTCP